MITVEELHKTLRYDPDTGLFYWKIAAYRNVKKPGDVAGLPKKNGYSQIRISNKTYAAHRLAFFYMTGAWPVMVDHIDGDKGNNQWSNLRECSGSTQNNANMRVPSRNTSGIKGVSWSTTYGKWYASIMRKGRSYNLGYHDRKEDAAAAYQDAAVRLFGEFARVA